MRLLPLCASILGALRSVRGAVELVGGKAFVGFLGEDLSEANAYVRGFHFWVSYVNANLGADSAGFRVGSRPYRIEPVRARYNESADEASVRGFAEGWASQGVWMVVMAVPTSSAQMYSAAFSSLGINHIDVAIARSAWFGELANPGLFGIRPPADEVADGFLSVAAPSSSRGLCLLGDAEVEALMGASAASSVVAQAAEQEVPWVMGADFHDSGDIEESKAFMRNYSQAVVDSGCDVLVAYVAGEAAEALQEALANASAPLVAELILPMPNLSAWASLGRTGEHVFTSTPWHPYTYYDCMVFKDTSNFLTAFRQWHLHYFNVERDPTVEEALTAAAATTFQVAVRTEAWFPGEVDPQQLAQWQGVAALEEDVSELNTSSMTEADDGLPDLFPYRMRKSLEALNATLFIGDVSFGPDGARSGGDFVTVQFQPYYEALVEKAVRPLDATQGGAVVPMDSFEARRGCPPGAVTFDGDTAGRRRRRRRGGAVTLGAADVAGSSCTPCSGALDFQDEYGQTACKECPLGHVPSESRAACVPCGPGSFRGEGDEECILCAEGEFAGGNGSSACQPCPAGEFARRRGQPTCEACPGGSVSPQEGARSCFPCTAGYSTAGQSGATACVPCDRGFYAEGTESSNCTACPESFGTEDKAADSREKCVCPPGSYWHKEGPDATPRCEALHCDEALLCDGWSNEPPQVAAGFSGGAEDFHGSGPSYLVRCASEKDCPGRLALGSCPATRANVPGCGSCEEGYSKTLGECILCSETPYYVPVVILVAAMILVVVILCGVHFRDYSVDSKAMMRILATAGIVIPSLQILVVFRFIEIDWPEPIATIHTAYQAVLEPTKLMNLKCMLSVKKAWQSYLSVVLLWPVVATLLFVVLVIPRWLPGPLRRTISNKQIFQLEGLLVLTLYISISMLSLQPWQCEANPDGTSSVVANREVLCWDSQEHVAMLAMSTLAILILVVGFMSLVAWATYMYPISIQGQHGLQFLTRFGWIFNRYKLEKYYYGLAYCARNLLVTLVPVIFTGNVPLQLLLVASMLQVSLVLQCWVQPWKTTVANKLDAACCGLLILTLVAACVLLDLEQANMKALVSGFFYMTWGVLGIGVTVLLCHNAYIWWRPRRKYSFFLCHHKQGAAMLARWLKIQLKMRQQGQVFLDSDMLHRIDMLFELVGHQTKNFVVLLTKETLSRIWCAGEIATAMQCNVNIILLACNDYEEPTDEFISKLGDLWSSAQLTEVARQGVALPEIQEAYRMLRTMPKVHLDRTSNVEEQMKVVENLLGQGGVRVWERSAGVLPTGSSKGSHVASSPCRPVGDLSATPVYIAHEQSPQRATTPLERSQPSQLSRNSTRIAKLVVGNLADPETMVVCRVVQLLLQQQIQAPVHVTSTSLDEAITLISNLEPSAKIAVVLTRGVLESPIFAALLAKAVQSDGNGTTFAPIIADHYFTIPDAKFLRDLEEGRIIKAEDLVPLGVLLSEVARAYKCLLRTICKRFTTEGSERVQQAEIQEIATLFLGSANGGQDFGPGNSLRLSKNSAQDGKDCTPTASTCTDSRPNTPCSPPTGKSKHSGKLREPERQFFCSSRTETHVQPGSQSGLREASVLETTIPPTEEPKPPVASLIPVSLVGKTRGGLD